MGQHIFGIPPDLVSSLVQGFGLRAAVETGTNYGDSAQLLAKYVPDVWTIELSKTLVDLAKERHGHVPGIRFIHGDSADVLTTLAPQIVSPTLFWLDAHWCGNDTAGVEAQCPLMEELAALDSAPAAAESCILIDDAITYLGGPPPAWESSDFPPFIDIVDALRSRHPRFVTVLQDVIIAVPPDGREIVEQYWQEEMKRDLERYQASFRGKVRSGAHRVLPDAIYEWAKEKWK